jgi:hypothetical protein
MRLWSALLALSGIAVVVAVAAVLRWLRAESNDLGAVSEQWMAQQRSNSDDD